jgi:hypothetical protein
LLRKAGAEIGETCRVFDQAVNVHRAAIDVRGRVDKGLCEGEARGLVF